MPTLQISVTPRLEQLVQEKIASGLFRDASDVVCEALRNLDNNRELIDELLFLRFGKVLIPGIEEARRDEFVNESFDEIIASAELEDVEN